MKKILLLSTFLIVYIIYYKKPVENIATVTDVSNKTVKTKKFYINPVTGKPEFTVIDTPIISIYNKKTPNVIQSYD